jgi:hypothetical protein
MASKAETLAIAQALIALSAAVEDAQRALRLLTPPESDEFTKHLKYSTAASDECLEHIQKLLSLIEQGRE